MRFRSTRLNRVGKFATQLEATETTYKVLTSSGETGSSYMNRHGSSLDVRLSGEVYSGGWIDQTGESSTEENEAETYDPEIME